MASDTGFSPDAVASAASAAEPTRSEDFYATLRVLEAAQPELPRIGEAIHASDEPLRLAQRPSLAFESAAIVNIAKTGRVPRVEVSFFGVFGPNGPLPLHLTEYVYQRIHHAHDHTLARFADIFHHRLLALLYRTWAVAQPTVSHDRPRQDSFARRLGALVGLRKAAHSEDQLDRFARYHAGQFTSQARHPEGLAKVVSSFFDCQATVEEFVGEWLPLPDEHCWKMAASAQAAVATPLGRLGQSTRIGRVVWSRAGKFRLSLGPLERSLFERLMPGGADLPQLVALVQRYAGPELSWELRLTMNAEDMRPTILGQSGRIGRDAYLLQRGANDNKQWADLVFEPLSHAS